MCAALSLVGGGHDARYRPHQRDVRFSSFASQACSGTVTPNHAGIAAPGLAVVLDGLSAPDGTGTGCRHGTPWYVRQLGPRLLTLASDPSNSLADALAEAIAKSPASIPAAT